MPLAEEEVQAALDKITQMFPSAPAGKDEEVNKALDNIDKMWPSKPGAPSGVNAAPMVNGMATRGRTRVDSSARPAEFYKPGKFVQPKTSKTTDWASYSIHGINEPALRQRLESKAIDQAAVDRIQLDFTIHDKLSPEDMSKLQELVQQAHRLHSIHDDSGAEAIYSQVLEADPLDFECLTNLGKITYSKGNLAKARDLFERAVVVRPEREKTMYHLARVLFDQKEYARAKILFEQVVQGYKDEDIIGDACDQPTYHNSIAMLGLIHQKVFNQTEKAEQLYKVVLRADPDHVLTLDHRCSLLANNGMADEAAKLHKRVCTLDPNHTKKACPYLDSLFPDDANLLHQAVSMQKRIEMFGDDFMKGARKKSWTNHPLRSLRKKVMRIVGAEHRPPPPGAAHSGGH